MPRPALLACLLLVIPLAGCTTYSWDDGRRETVWGSSAADAPRDRATEPSPAPRPTPAPR